MTAHLSFAALALALVAGLGPQTARADEEPLARAARTVLEQEGAASERAIRELRAAGPRGLETLLALLDAEFGASRADAATLRVLARPARTPQDAAAAARRDRLFAAIDRVAAQKDARFAGLFWHTDEAEALKRARAEGKPVLSLRLLGRLDEDASCANSRFFRTALYPDPGVGRLLRENFVLHWRSMRPVPKITIDFGDGRVIERPITGNSVHLVLDAEGNVLDAIPGLVTPATFRESLGAAEALFHTTAGIDGAKRPDVVRAYHRERLAALDAAWNADLAALGRTPTRPQDLDDPAMWTAMAARHADEARLAPASIALFGEKHRAVRVNRLTMAKAVMEDPLMRAVQRFQSSLAADSVRNEQRMHRVIHEWFVAGLPPVSAQAFAERVYREIFLTPPEDPWLGLLPTDEYAALEGGGVREPAVPVPGR